MPHLPPALRVTDAFNFPRLLTPHYVTITTTTTILYLWVCCPGFRTVVFVHLPVTRLIYAFPAPTRLLLLHYHRRNYYRCPLPITYVLPHGSLPVPVVVIWLPCSFCVVVVAGCWTLLFVTTLVTLRPITLLPVPAFRIPTTLLPFRS